MGGLGVCIYMAFIFQEFEGAKRTGFALVQYQLVVCFWLFSGSYLKRKLYSSFSTFFAFLCPFSLDIDPRCCFNHSENSESAEYILLL